MEFIGHENHSFQLVFCLFLDVYVECRGVKYINLFNKIP